MTMLEHKNTDPAEKAHDQRQAASDAAELLAERLGPDLPRFFDLFERASFRFRPALVARIGKPCSSPVFSGPASHYDATARKR